ncbi:TPA: hypothetical protein ACKQBO_005990 [Pseudomonas aeruginosa]
MMSAVRGLLGSVWNGVSLPLYIVWAVVVRIASSVRDFFWPRGYKPCNELADTFVEECANHPAGQAVRLPWVDSAAVSSMLMNNTGRLLSYVAIASGWFGVAVKETGKGYAVKRSYRYYYRRSLTGNWFAEIWSVPKSGLVSAALAIPFVDMARDVMKGHAHGHEGLLLLVSGLLLVTCFMPRAILGRGTHFAAMAPINGGALGGYGCAQVINWGAALGGLSYLWLAVGAEWNLAAVVIHFSDLLAKFAARFDTTIADKGLLLTAVLIPLHYIAIALFGMAWTVIPAAAFWYVSLRFMAARKAKAQLETLPFNENQAAMYDGSDFEKVAELRAPQVLLGFLVYIGVLLGVALYPDHQFHCSPVLIPSTSAEKKPRFGGAFSYEKVFPPGFGVPDEGILLSPPRPMCIGALSPLVAKAAMLVRASLSPWLSPVTSWPPLTQRRPRSNSSDGKPKMRTMALYAKIAEMITDPKRMKRPLNPDTTTPCT